MKKRVIALAGVCLAAGSAFLHAQEDSVRLVQLQGVQVVGTRATAKTPMVHTNVDRSVLSKTNYGQDLPFLLTTTPSVVVTSDAGAGIGYTGIRIRGTDASRINVTANGIPMNDAESHSMFWVNTPDLVSSTNDIQIQRGVGTSTNGAGAFGGSINLTTEPLTTHPSAEISASYGSFNTHKEMVKVNTGLIGGKWGLSARLSNIGSDGYIDRAATNLKSYFFQGGYYSGGTIVRFITYGGKEETYHAWTGQTKAEMALRGRRYNPCGEIYKVLRDSNGVPLRDDDGNLLTEVDGYYKDQTDNYTQHNYQLLFTQQLGERWHLNVNFHYTDGDGYYEEYKDARTLEEYGLIPFVPADPSKEAYLEDGMVVKSDLVRRKMMDNWFGGGVFSLNYASPRLQVSLGGAVNRYDGDHIGQVTWVQNYAGDPSFRPGHEYYFNNGTKDDANIYARANWQATEGLYLYGDLQYRHINYRIKGANDNWDWNEGEMQALDVNNDYDFFNPKAGVFYDIDERFSAYASFAVANKEPTRNNFTDAKPDATPCPERLYDWEAGASFRSKFFSASANFYYMKYKDQLILTGEVNHIGEPLADNVPDSYRAGVELTASAQFTPWLRWDVNATFSTNKIKDYTEYVDDYDADGDPLYTQTANRIGTTEISFSPSITAGSVLTATYRNFTAALQSNYVGKQYMTNSEQDEVSLDAYFVNNLRLDYTFAAKALKLNSVSIGLAVNNIFNEKYCSNGYGWSHFEHNGADTRRVNTAYYFAQAGTNILANLTVRF